MAKGHESLRQSVNKGFENDRRMPTTEIFFFEKVAPTKKLSVYFSVGDFNDPPSVRAFSIKMFDPDEGGALQLNPEFIGY